MAEQPEVGEGGPAAEQEAVRADLRLEGGQDPAIALLDHGGVLGGAADQRHPFDLALREIAGGGFARLSGAVGEEVVGDPEPRVPDVGVAGPPVMEHRLGEPFVRHVFDEVAEEGVCGVVREDRAPARVAPFEVFRDRGGVDVEAAVLRILEDRDEGRPEARELGSVPFRPELPDEGQAAIAEDRPELERIRRAVAADEPVRRGRGRWVSAWAGAVARAVAGIGVGVVHGAMPSPHARGRFLAGPRRFGPGRLPPRRLSVSPAAAHANRQTSSNS